VLDIFPCTGEVIVYAQNFVTLLEQGLAQKRANKTGPTRHQDAMFQSFSPMSVG
jgi:hypothetical protein